MKVKGVSFSAYKVKLDVYAFEKLDLFSFLFTQVILDESLNKEEKIVDCLFNLDIKEDLLYLFNNVYYKMIDNKLIEETKEDIFDLKIKDINIDKRFIEYFKQGYFPILNEEVNKEFIYDIINDKLVVSDTLYSDTNLCAIRKDNSDESIETLVNRYKKSLLNVSDCDCVLKNKIVNPYYFEFELKDKDNKYVLQLDNKESVYKDLVSNSLFINDKV